MKKLRLLRWPGFRVCVCAGCRARPVRDGCPSAASNMRIIRVVAFAARRMVCARGVLAELATTAVSRPSRSHALS